MVGFDGLRRSQMDRNIVTRADVAAAKRAAAEMAYTSSGDVDMGGPDVSLGSKVKAAKPDQWYEKLAKYIPAEALGLYIALDSFVRGSLERPGLGAEQRVELVSWLFVALAAAIAFNYAYMRRVWNVRRLFQIGASTLALIAYVIGLGGAFEAAGWTTPFHGGMVLILTTAFLSFVEPPGPAASRDKATAR